MILAQNTSTSNKMGMWLECWLGILVPLLGLDVFVSFLKYCLYYPGFILAAIFIPSLSPATKFLSYVIDLILFSSTKSLSISVVWVEEILQQYFILVNETADIWIQTWINDIHKVLYADYAGILLHNLHKVLNVKDI